MEGIEFAAYTGTKSRRRLSPRVIKVDEQGKPIKSFLKLVPRKKAS